MNLEYPICNIKNAIFINKVMKNYIDSLKIDFINFCESRQDDEYFMNKNFPSYFDISIEFNYTDQFISYLIQNESYVNASPHPNHDSYVFNYKFGESKLLKPNDFICAKDSIVWKLLQSDCLECNKIHFNFNGVNINNCNVFIGKDGLYFYFSDYALCGYAPELTKFRIPKENIFKFKN